jgi:cell division protein FtsN
MLPNFEVVVPEADRNPRRDQPSVEITKPAAYILQVGSFRNRADAERHRDRLAKQGIDTVIQHVTIDENEWHRVRFGPSRDLKLVNAVREQLHAAQINVTVYEVGE